MSERPAATTAGADPASAPLGPAHARSASEVLAELGSDPVRGLTEAEVLRRRVRWGWNELAEQPPEPAWKKLLSQFNELVIWILIAAAIVSGAMNEWTDAIAIIAIVVLNGLLGFFQEQRAEQSLAALRKMSAPQARVLRDGVRRLIPARELVPGDRIDLEAGDSIPADARLLEAFGLRTQEAALTGESTPVSKDAAAAALQAPAAERGNMVYMGTVAVAGTAGAVVTAGGMNTELGRIAGMLRQAGFEPTPLQKQLAGLGKVLVAVCLALVGAIFLLELLRGAELADVFLRSVSLAVAAVPEGLPAVVTVALALGLQRMVKRNALIRKLPSVETLGAVTVICSDKTGTLTRNEMTVREVLAGGVRYEVTGVGYVPRGQFVRDGAAVDPAGEPDVTAALTVAARCNHARLNAGVDDAWTAVGDPTEAALVAAALKGRVSGANSDVKVLHEIPFDSERKAMSVVVAEAEGGPVLYTKGAPEVILAKCAQELRAGRTEPLTEARRAEIAGVGAEMASRALRVLALAMRRPAADGGGEYAETDLVFVGLVGMIDPPRDEAKEAVRRCREAGIRPVMITGDHPRTALAVARELKIAVGDEAAVTGVELDGMTDEQLAERVEGISVYARVSAEHKLRVVKAWKRRGHVVAMTGDGVNDAPAVQSADIGIAMGVGGTDVTKEASDMVLIDDNFASIVNAVEEGRAIYDNIRKFLVYLMSCNAGELVLMLAAGLLGLPAPLLPVQLLWVNLVTDGLPALALSLEPAEGDVMRRRPRRPDETMLSWRLGAVVVWQGGLIGLTALAAFAWVYWSGPPEETVARARTTAFCVLVFAELFRAMTARSLTRTFLQLGPLGNPYLFAACALSGALQLGLISLPAARGVFDVEPHALAEWAWILLLALAPVTVIEVVKLVRQGAGSRQ